MTEVALPIVPFRRAWTVLSGSFSRRRTVAGGVAILIAASLGGALAATTFKPSAAAIDPARETPKIAPPSAAPVTDLVMDTPTPSLQVEAVRPAQPPRLAFSITH